MPRAAAHEPEDLLRGTLDALVLKTRSWGGRHGCEIARGIKTEALLRVIDAAQWEAL